jgi:hypothetical protein
MATTNLTARLNGRKPAQRNTPLPIWLQRAQEHGLPAKELAR